MILKWQLSYPDNSIQNEGSPSNSIRGGLHGADKLNICNEEFEVLKIIDLDFDWRPVFYRIKQLEMNISGKFGELTTITVFGRYNLKTDNLILFQWKNDKEDYEKCIQSYIDWVAIRNCTAMNLEVLV